MAKFIGMKKVNFVKEGVKSILFFYYFEKEIVENKQCKGIGLEAMTEVSTEEFNLPIDSDCEILYTKGTNGKAYLSEIRLVA